MQKAILLILFALAVCARADAPDSVRSSIEALINSPEYRHAHWGIQIVELDSGKPVYELNTEKLFRPASVAKLFTVAAALHALGPDYRFRTPVYRTGQVRENGALDGDLILVASGDPTLGGRAGKDGRIAYRDHDHTYAGFFDDAALTEPDPLAGLNQLARQVAAAGIRRVNGDVIVDDRLFETAGATGSGPSRISPIVVNDNVIDFTITPAAPGAPARVEWRPRTAAFQVDARIMTAEPFGPASVRISSAGPGRIVVRGEIPAGRPPLVRIQEAPDPASFARALFIEALQRAGVSVEGSALAENPSSRLPSRAEVARLTRVAELVSPPFSDAARLILKVSHNLHASALPLILAAREGRRTLEDGLLIQGRILRDMGLPVDTFSLGSGAGGSPADLVSPSATVQLLRIMSRRRDFPFFENALPALGVDGTLADVIEPDSPVRGKARAKTGTFNSYNPLNGSVMLTSKALAGYLTTAGGKRLAFAFFVNYVPPDGPPFPVPIAIRQGRALARLCEIVYGGM